MQQKPKWLDNSTILRAMVGSQALGLNTPESDTDEMGVCIEPIEERVVTGEGFQQYIYRSAWERTGIADAPSEPGDTELVVYGLRKFCGMALNGNPTVLQMLFISSAPTMSLGTQLQELAPLFISRRTGGAFLGYMQAQHKSMMGQRSKKVTRQDLIAKYGFDTKFAMHVLRLGMQGVELLKTGRLNYPMLGEARDYLRGVREGAETFDAVTRRSLELEQEIKGLISSCSLPDQPDREGVNAWMQERYFRWWSASATHLRPVAPHSFEAYKPELPPVKYRTRLDLDMEGLNDEILGREPVQPTAGRESCIGILQAALGGSKE